MKLTPERFYDAQYPSDTPTQRAVRLVCLEVIQKWEEARKQDEIAQQKQTEGKQ